MSAKAEVKYYAPELRRLSPAVTGAIIRLRSAAYSDGVFPAKVKVLTALAIAASIKCEPCVEYYAKKAYEMGASKEELIEILNVTIAMGGCPGEAWADKALRAYNKHADGYTVAVKPAEESPHEACCR